MTTVAQLIEHLQTLPQYAEVEVLVERGERYEEYTTHVAIDLNETDVLDFTHRSNTLYFGKVFVQLNGEPE